MKAQGLAKAKGKEEMERGNVLVLQSLKSCETSGSSYPMVSQSVLDTIASPDATRRPSRATNVQRVGMSVPSPGVRKIIARHSMVAPSDLIQHPLNSGVGVVCMSSKLS